MKLLRSNHYHKTACKINNQQLLATKMINLVNKKYKNIKLELKLKISWSILRRNGTKRKWKTIRQDLIIPE